MITIVTHGITYIEQLDGSCEWYWGTDYIHGDLYEAEEAYYGHYPVDCNRLVFVHYPDGRVVEPMKGKPGQYFGQPISYCGKAQILMADFRNQHSVFFNMMTFRIRLLKLPRCL